MDISIHLARKSCDSRLPSEGFFLICLSYHRKVEVSLKAVRKGAVEAPCSCTGRENGLALPHTWRPSLWGW